MKKICLLLSLLLFTICSFTQSLSSKVELDIVNSTSRNITTFNIDLDLPVFSGTLLGDGYEFTFGGALELYYESKIGLSYDMDYNWSANEIFKKKNNILVRNLDENRFRQNLVTYFTLFKKYGKPKNPGTVRLGKGNNVTYYTESTDYNELRSYSVRFGYSSLGGITILNEALTLPTESISFPFLGSVSYWHEVYKDIEPVNSKNVEFGMTTNFARIGFQRIYSRMLDMDVTNIDNTYMKKGTKSYNSAFSRKLYFDVLIKTGDNASTNLDLIQVLTNESGTTSYSIPFKYDFMEIMSDVPVGAAIGVQTTNFSKKFCFRTYMEGGYRPGLGTSFDDHFYLNWGVAMGFGTYHNI